MRLYIGLCVLILGSMRLATAQQSTVAPNDIFGKPGPTHRSVIYPVLSFGCRSAYHPAFAFDPDRTISLQAPQTWTTADLYETAPKASLHTADPCYKSPLAVGTTTVWHVSHGGVLLPFISLEEFMKLPASAWRNAGTVFAPMSPSVLLLKTKEGRVVKAMLPIGPYEVSSSSGAFTY